MSTHYELVNLIETIDYNKFIDENTFLKEYVLYYRGFDSSWFLIDENNIIKWFEHVFLIPPESELFFFSKLFLCGHIFLTKLFFFWLTPVTFWLLPSSILLVSGIILLLLIWPYASNFKIWKKAKFIFLLVAGYQLGLVFLYLFFMNWGFLLKVGLNGAFFLPINFSFIKLLVFILILLTIFLTITCYVDCRWDLIPITKPELCPIIFFLGFSCGMVLLQNDLFSIFLYFEIISFCIYGLLFLQPWSGTQLNALVWYVLLSLWVSTCYLLGLAFYLAAANTTTSLFYFYAHPFFSFDGWMLPNIEETEAVIVNFWSLLLTNIEMIFAITFFLIYFFFKLGVGPFYSWTIEVYSACPTSTLIAVSLIPKLIYFTLLFFLLLFSFIEYQAYWSVLLFTVGILTVFIGAFGILITDRLKEIYAWSSIIHSGNMLIILSCCSMITLTFLIFYLVSYTAISIGFILLLVSMWNKTSGWFIKTVSELFNLSFHNSNFYFLSILLIASAAGFTPFLSFFMKFSLLLLLSTHYGIIFTIFIGLLNIIGSIAYLWILWHLIGFWFELSSEPNLEKDNCFTIFYLPYSLGMIFNGICFLLICSFFFYSNILIWFGELNYPFELALYYSYKFDVEFMPLYDVIADPWDEDFFLLWKF